MSLNLTSSIKESNAEIDIDLAWYGTPYEFNTASLSGDLKWRLGDGYITDISDGGARVFSLLSLDSLVRKLKLDFRDVFAKGFFYNSMKGTMQIDKGVAYTNDAELNGVPADLTIKGYADLNTRKIDYTMWIAPEVTSSIPVIVAWMVNPVTGLAALAIDKVLHSARVISEIEYTITGNYVRLMSPVVTEKGKKSREIEIPQPKQDDLPQEKKIIPLTRATRIDSAERAGARTMIAVLQWTVSSVPEKNLDYLHQELIKLRKLYRTKQLLVCLPEGFACFDATPSDLMAFAHSSEPFIASVCALAKEYNVWINAGTIPIGEADKYHAASLLINSNGEVVARYNKIHLFDVDVDDSKQNYRESNSTMSGVKTLLWLIHHLAK